MGLEVYGTKEFADDIGAMADALSESGGGRAVTYILQSAAAPIRDKMLQITASSPVPRSGALRRSISVGSVVRSKAGTYKVRVGVFKGSEAGAYARYVEFGHGGKRGPAAPHPYVRPAFDAEVGTAYEQMKQDLATALKSRGL